MHEVVLDTEENTVLVAYVPTPKDFAIARLQGWYRIPVDHAPNMLRRGKLTHIAFYHPAAFGEERYTIRWYSPVTSLKVRRRVDILPQESLHPNAQKEYYVVGCAEMRELPSVIRSRRPRRPIFIPTTYRKLQTATDINHLFNDSPLENLLWQELNKADIPTERQFDVRAGDRWFKLDFAVFCKTANLGIECDGDRYHMQPEAVEKDKWRTNLLASVGWHMLQLTSSKLRNEMPLSLSMVRESINRYGGLRDPVPMVAIATPKVRMRRNRGCSNSIDPSPSATFGPRRSVLPMIPDTRAVGLVGCYACRLCTTDGGLAALGHIGIGCGIVGGRGALGLGLVVILLVLLRCVQFVYVACLFGHGLLQLRSALGGEHAARGNDVRLPCGALFQRHCDR
ncbi:MAG: DUF559 domain-containing protein [Flavobacteriales bacterium]|nr:DUF559 domain-containing protein [Flavobacteriales bacterium]